MSSSDPSKTPTGASAEALLEQAEQRITQFYRACCKRLSRSLRIDSDSGRTLPGVLTDLHRSCDPIALNRVSALQLQGLLDNGRANSLLWHLSHCRNINPSGLRHLLDEQARQRAHNQAANTADNAEIQALLDEATAAYKLHCEADLFALELRLQSLSKTLGQKLSAQHWSAAYCFNVARIWASEQQLDGDAELLFLAYFDQVLAKLAPRLYSDLNQLLLAGKVLPTFSANHPTPAMQAPLAGLIRRRYRSEQPSSPPDAVQSAAAKASATTGSTSLELDCASTFRQIDRGSLLEILDQHEQWQQWEVIRHQRETCSFVLAEVGGVESSQRRSEHEILALLATGRLRLLAGTTPTTTPPSTTPPSETRGSLESLNETGHRTEAAAPQPQELYE